jgi:hypothetical protein
VKVAMNRHILHVKSWLNDFHPFSPPPSEINGKVPRWIASLCILWCMVDFAAFVLVSIFIGGDAINGHILDGYYFVCMHDRCHEVAKAVFEYSRWHAISLFVSFPLAFLLSWLASQPKEK